jgi:hypothetical protein
MLSGEPRKPQLELTITIFLQKAYLNFTKQCIEWSSIVYFIYINLIQEAVLDVHDFANIRRDSRECDVFFVAISKWEEYLAFRLLCDIRCSPKTVLLARYFFLQLILTVALDRKSVWLSVLPYFAKNSQFLSSNYLKRIADLAFYKINMDIHRSELCLIWFQVRDEDRFSRSTFLLGQLVFP